MQQSIDRTFNDSLYEWMQRAPWLAISAVAHVLLFIVLLAIPWELLQKEEPVVIASGMEQFPDDVFEDPPDEIEPPVEDVVDPDEPTIMDATLPPIDDATDEPSEAATDSFSDLLDASMDVGLSEIGIGGGPKGKYSGRDFGDGGRGPAGGRGTEPSLAAGLVWLAAHQSPDGSWDSDGFNANCGELGAGTCGDPGSASHDVGLTGLALLAFLGNGNTTQNGEYRAVVQRAVKWLRFVQDPETGLIGEPLGKAYVYDHGIAALALCEAYYFSRSPLLRNSAQQAVNWISRARDPYGAWRYDVPSNGESDTSVTGWMVFALAAAKDAGLRVDSAASAGALAWLDEVTDPATGRCGYDTPGSKSSRITRVNDHFPVDRGEAMTAVALLSRFFLGQRPEDTPVMNKHADLLARSLPEWDPDGFGCDMYYWYYGSYAMYQMGGARHWKPWNQAMKRAVVESQRKDGDARGSWDPIGPWGHAGGRVYSTAMMTLCLEVYFRYGRLAGMR
jgi:hypothetical protein